MFEINIPSLNIKQKVKIRFCLYTFKFSLFQYFKSYKLKYFFVLFIQIITNFYISLFGTKKHQGNITNMQLLKCYILVYRFPTTKNSINLSKNYYKILQVETGCDQKVIKKSYLKLVKLHHPDVNPKGKQKFTEVQEAYEVLSNEQNKKYYDQNYSTNGKKKQQSASNQYQNYKTSTSTSGHEYYTHRTYNNQKPYDYYYKNSDPRRSYNYQSSQRQQQDEQQAEYRKSQQHVRKKQQQYDRKARARTAYQQHRRQQKRREEQMYRHQTQEQRKMRDKIRHMKGFASPYNALWGQNQMRYSNMTTQQKEKKSQRQLKELMPDKVKSYYQKIMQRLQKIAKK